MNNKSSGWWITLQGIAIVGSILLAFIIEAWWSEKQDTEERGRLLQVLEAETTANLAKMERNRKYRIAVTEVCEKILATSQENISSKEFDVLLADLLWALHVNFAVGALTNLVDGGKLALVDDADVSLQISRVSTYLKEVQRIELLDTQLNRSRLLPLLFRNASLTQISNVASARGAPGDGNWEPSPAVFDKGGRDHRGLLAEDEFRGVVLLKQWDQIDAMLAYERLGTMMNELLVILSGR